MKNIKNKNILIILLILLIIDTICEIKNIIVFNNIIEPITWFLFDVFLIYESSTLHKRFHHKSDYTSKMIIITLLYYLLYFYLGFIFGYTKSPYDHTIIGIIKNIIIQLLPILGIELSRNILVNKNESNKTVILITTLLLILIEINFYNLYSSFSSREGSFKYIVQFILPIISTNLLFTYLCLIGGASLPLIYRIIELIMLLILPILPNLDWFANSSLGILIPAIYFLLFKYIITKNNTRERKKNKTNKITLIIVIILSFTLVSFMLGIFKYEPVAILSNSMHPIYDRGDVIVYEKIKDSDLKNIDKNSIIIYRIGNQLVAHRVVNVIKENGKTYYQTKGDNNNAVDSNYVKPENVIGIYKIHIKFIGYPSIWLSEFFNGEEAKVETK